MSTKHSTSQPIISLQKVSCGYDGKTILHEVTLKLAKGSFSGLVGPSGSGKTTLLRTILGQVKAKTGHVIVNGVTLRGRDKPNGIAYVPQLETVDWNFPITVEQVVLMGRIRAMSWLPWASRADRKALAKLLERLGLSGLSHHAIRELSGGQQQRVFLARALISKPSLLLLDEPTSGIDVKTRNQVLSLLHELNQEGMTILLTTHDLNSVAASLPQIICINGTILAQGSPLELFTPEILSQTYKAPMEVIRHQGHLLVVERGTR